MAEDLIVTGRITKQGPQAPLRGDGWTLPVYEYEVVEAAGSLTPGERLLVAHTDADVDDPGFALGRLRRLHLSSDLPRQATLLFRDESPSGNERIWYCVDSTRIDLRTPR